MGANKRQVGEGPDDSIVSLEVARMGLSTRMSDCCTYVRMYVVHTYRGRDARRSRPFPASSHLRNVQWHLNPRADRMSRTRELDHGTHCCNEHVADVVMCTSLDPIGLCRFRCSCRRTCAQPTNCRSGWMPRRCAASASQPRAMAPKMSEGEGVERRPVHMTVIWFSVRPA